MIKPLDVILQILLFSYFTRLISSQVDTNVQNLPDNLRNETTGFDHNMDWFKPNEMSNFAKFFLCVDVLQKLMNVTLTGGLFETKTSNYHLPNFEEKRLKIRNYDEIYPFAIRRVVHCPLNLITFENINYNKGTEFYITESPDKYCFYSLNPTYPQSEIIPVLHRTAKICALFLNIKLNKLELEQEFNDHLTRKGAEVLSWPYLNQISNTEKFMICLNVIEKLTRQSYFRIPFYSCNPNKSLPTCNTIDNRFVFTSYKPEHSVVFINVLSCPMHTIGFQEKNTIKGQPATIKLATSFYLAKSVNPNCFYKMGINGTMIVSEINKPLSHQVFIQGEICGIVGTVSADVTLIEARVLSAINTAHSHRADIMSGGELVLMSSSNLAQLCGDVYRSIYNKDYIYDNALFSPPVARQTTLLVGNLTMTLSTITCFMQRNNRYSAMLLAYSVSLGCVYKLKPIEYYNRFASKVKIEYEVCNVYPAQHFLQMKKPLNQPIF